MCGNQTCPLAWRDKLNLRMLCNELSEHGAIDLLQTLQPIALVLLDCCAILNLDPLEVLGPEMMGRINRRGDTRLWPTLSEAEDAEMIELAGIRDSEEPAPTIFDQRRPEWVRRISAKRDQDCPVT